MKMKRMLSIILSAFIIMTLLSTFSVSALSDWANGYSHTQIGDYVHTQDQWGNADIYGETISGYTGNESHLIIPDKMNVVHFNSYRGTKIPLNYNVTEITLPKTLEWLDIQAFAFFPNLEKINVPNFDCEVDADIFKGNNKLKFIEVAEDNQKYCDVDGILFNKDKTKIVYFPVGREEKTYEIPNTVTEIYTKCFYQANLTSITIPSTVTKIGWCAFSGSLIEAIEIPNSVTELYSLSNCKALKEVKLSNNINVLNDNLFFGCSVLESIIIPDSVIRIGEEAFRDCVALKNVQLPNSLTSIGEEAFFGCTSLEKIEIPDTVTFISNKVFYNCVNLKTIKLSNKLEDIGYCLFQNCKSLEKIEMPDSLKSIDVNAFKNCISLKQVKLPSGITEIGKRSFENSGLTSITIPKNVKTIYKNAFKGCENLTSVKFAGAVNNIGKSAFSKCVNLKTVNFTKGYLKKVYDYAFYKCEKLDKVTISNTKNVPTIAKSAFNKAKSGIKFYVKNNTVAKKLKAKLQKTNIKKAKIYRSAPILIYKNVG